MSADWSGVGELERSVMDWARSFGDRVVRHLLEGDWTSEDAKQEIQHLFGQLCDAARDRDSKRVRDLATQIAGASSRPEPEGKT